MSISRTGFGFLCVWARQHLAAPLLTFNTHIYLFGQFLATPEIWPLWTWAHIAHAQKWPCQFSIILHLCQEIFSIAQNLHNIVNKVRELYLKILLERNVQRGYFCVFRSIHMNSNGLGQYYVCQLFELCFIFTCLHNLFLI